MLHSYFRTSKDSREWVVQELRYAREEKGSLSDREGPDCSFTVLVDWPVHVHRGFLHEKAFESLSRIQHSLGDEDRLNEVLIRSFGDALLNAGGGEVQSSQRTVNFGYGETAANPVGMVLCVA